MQAERPHGLRGFLRTNPGKVLLIVLSAAVVFGTFTYVEAVLAIPLFIIVGLAIPIWVGIKRPKFLALSGLVVLVVVAPLASLVFAQDLRTPVAPTSSAVSSPSADGPVALAVDPVNGVVYAANYAGDSVLGVDASTGSVVGTVPVGVLPIALAVAPNGSTLYVLDYGSNEVSVVNVSRDAVVANVPVGTAPVALSLGPAGHAVFVANYGSADVSVVNTTQDKVVATVAVGTRPVALAADPATGEVYVANRGSGTVTAIFASNDTVARTVAVGAAPGSVAVNGNGSDVVVANSGSDTVTLVNSTSNAVVATVAVGIDPVVAVAGANDSSAYVSSVNASTVSVVSVPSGAVHNVTNVGKPGALAVDAADHRLYVADLLDGTVSVLVTSTLAVIASVTVGSQPTAIAVDPASGHWFAAAWGGQNVTVVDEGNNTVAKTVADGANGSLFENASMSPFLGNAGSLFNWTVTVDPRYIPEGAAVPVRLYLFVSTCPGATAPNNDSSCGSGYAFLSKPFNISGPLTAAKTISFQAAVPSDGIWSWTVELVLSGATVLPEFTQAANVTCLFGNATSTISALEGPVVGPFAATFSEVLPDIYITDLVYLGIPFYFVLVLYMWFKARERRRRDLKRQAAASGGGPPAGGTPAPASPQGAPIPSPGPPPAGGSSGTVPKSGGPPPASTTPELACPSCGAVVYPNEAKCWKCGSALGSTPGGSAPLPSGPKSS